MPARVIHFGDDRFNRLAPLKEAGYSIDACHTLEELKAALYSDTVCDALTIAEVDEPLLDAAVSIARSTSNAPMIFFQSSTSPCSREDFALVVPLLAQSGSWLTEIADLVAQRKLSKSEQPLRGRRGLGPEAPSARTSSALTAGIAHPQSSLERATKADGSGAGFLPFTGEPMSLLTLKAGQFIRSLTQEMLRELEAVTSFSFCAPGTVLFVEGQPPQEVFLLMEGQVKMFMNSNDGRRLTVHIANPGELLGLAAAFTSALHRTTAETLYPARLGCIRCSDLMKFLLNHPRALQAAARELGEGHERTYARLRTIGVTPSNRAKLARLLLEWAAQGKQTERGIQIHVALKHGEIAECIGTCRESVTRILRDLQRWQVIELRGSLLTISDFSALEQCAGLK